MNVGTRDYYTRDGSFDVALDGSIVNQTTGMKVQGWLAGATGTIDPTQPLTAIQIPFGATVSGQPSSDVTVRGNTYSFTTPTLESNVDLALQFTNMIMAERGLQANSRVITTSDEMLQDLVNLKR